MSRCLYFTHCLNQTRQVCCLQYPRITVCNVEIPPFFIDEECNVVGKKNLESFLVVHWIGPLLQCLIRTGASSSLYVATDSFRCACETGGTDQEPLLLMASAGALHF